MYQEKAKIYHYLLNLYHRTHRKKIAQQTSFIAVTVPVQGGIYSTISPLQTCFRKGIQHFKNLS
jgi:hypothetical protein